MLKEAYGNISTGTLNKLINEGNYKYYFLGPIKYFDSATIYSSNLNSIQKISMNPKNDDVLGYFQAYIDQENNKISSVSLVKFSYRFDNSYDSFKSDEDIAEEDFSQFVNEIMNHPLYNRVEFMAIADNHSNKTYEKWLEEYNGERFLLKNYIKLSEGKLYDVYMYWFNRIGDSE
jgi:hypothetical protein